MRRFLTVGLAFFLILTMSISCVSFAYAECVEEKYLYGDYSEGFFGKVSVDKDGVIVGGAALLGDGRWAYEYYNTETKTFHPMGAYFATSHTDEGWVHGGWAEFYTASAESAWTEGSLTYCTIGSGGKRMHPGNGAGPVITYTVPASGVVSFSAAIAPYGDNPSASEDGGNCVSLYLNDRKIWPEREEDGCFYSDTASKTKPVLVETSAMEVNAGDRIRLVLTTKPGTTRKSKGCDLVGLPVVTYHGANADAYAPEDFCTLSATTVTYDSITLSVDLGSNLTGYRLYLDNNLLTPEPIADSTYTLTGLTPNEYYMIRATVEKAYVWGPLASSNTLRVYTSPDGPSSPSVMVDRLTSSSATIRVTDFGKAYLCYLNGNLVGTDSCRDEYMILRDLSPDTEYVLTVQAVDQWGKEVSERKSITFRTSSALSDANTEEDGTSVVTPAEEGNGFILLSVIVFVLLFVPLLSIFLIRRRTLR